MKKTINILLVDDHPIIIDAYTTSINLFKEKNDLLNINIESANNCEKALLLLENKCFDVAFLDVRIPSSSDTDFKSGEDIALHIKKHFSQTKIIMITGHYDHFIFINLLNNINPFGLLFKGDVDQRIISETLESILNESPYYSKTILKLFRKNLSSNIVLNKIDKQILYEISKGKKTKDLTENIPLSIGGIEKRKRQLKEIFDVPKKDDEDLLKSAKQKGYL